MAHLDPLSLEAQNLDYYATSRGGTATAYGATGVCGTRGRVGRREPVAGRGGRRAPLLCAGRGKGRIVALSAEARLGDGARRAAAAAAAQHQHQHQHQHGSSSSTRSEPLDT